MNRLKCTEKTYITADYADFEQLVADEFNKPGWSFIASADGSNDAYQVIVAEKRALDEYEQKEFDEWLTISAGDNEYCPDYEEFSVYTLATELCNRGCLDPGEYLIEVCW